VTAVTSPAGASSASEAGDPVAGFGHQHVASRRIDAHAPRRHAGHPASTSAGA
jgi:hypothetical protein